LEIIAMDEEGQFLNWFNGTDHQVRFIHVDLALCQRDRAALSLVHCFRVSRISNIKWSKSLQLLK
jgi:hypothetical protein